MELALYFANMDRLAGIEDALRPFEAESIHPFVSSVLFPDAMNSREYMGNMAALKRLEDYVSPIEEASRLYFGQEFCEHLIPSPEELRQAVYFARQLGWAFTYVTGYLTRDGITRTRANLDALVELEGEEVVVNDRGLLSVLRRDYPSLTPVMGRLLVRQTRHGVIHADRPRRMYTRAIHTDVEQLLENASVVAETIIRARPATTKGTYVLRMTLSATMSPGVRVDSRGLVKAENR